MYLVLPDDIWSFLRDAIASAAATTSGFFDVSRIQLTADDLMNWLGSSKLI